MIDLKAVDKSWTLFIDRDGVINEEKHEDYIHTWDEFRFYPEAKIALKIFAETFGKIIVITNQRGVGKGVTRLEDVETIHRNMLAEIANDGGRIDKVYFCPELESENRKPNPGMGFQALKDFPEIDVKKSIMIGNTLSDMEFGRNLGVAATIFVTTTRPETPIPHSSIDFVFDDISAVARVLTNTTT